MVTITLSVIMKNESKVLYRMLESVYKLIDRYDIIDTGSTDNSMELVRNFFTQKNIPGDIYYRPFDNFEASRNFAIEMAKDKADFCFWIDCDEVLKQTLDTETIKAKLQTVDAAIITVIYGPLTYGRMSFFRTTKPFQFVGKVHEVLTCKETFTQINLPEVVTNVFSDGNSWSNIKEKYLKHAEIFEKEYKENNSPRDLFYLAQSYKDAGELDKAEYYYNQRSNRDDGFYEEKYYSQFMSGVIAEMQNLPVIYILNKYLKAHEIDHLRAEHILNTILTFQRNSMYNVSYIFSKYAVEKYHNKNPYPNRLLFIDTLTYSEKILRCYLLDCQKTGNQINFKLL